jgi:hypothetical protein
MGLGCDILYHYIKIANFEGGGLISKSSPGGGVIGVLCYSVKKVVIILVGLT